MCKSGKPWRLPSSFFAQISIVASRQIINTRMPRVLVVKLTESYQHFLPNFINVCSSGFLSCSREAGEHKYVQRCRKPVLMLDSETWRQGIRFATCSALEDHRAMRWPAIEQPSRRNLPTHQQQVVTDSKQPGQPTSKVSVAAGVLYHWWVGWSRWAFASMTFVHQKPVDRRHMEDIVKYCQNSERGIWRSS